MKKVLVLGGSGLVGSRFIELASDYEIKAPTHEELDLLDFSKLERYLEETGAETVINFAAFTNVDEAEKGKDNERSSSSNKDGLVYKLNVSVPEVLARYCLSSGKYFVQISTDYVFDGTKEAPYIEDDIPSPINWYGTTKFLGEDAVKNISSDFLIVRPEMPYSSHFEKKLDLARTFLKLLKQGKEINAISDQKITPTFVDTLVYGLFKLIEVKASGIYHLASTDTTTPYDFANLLAEVFRLDKNLIKSIPFEDYNKTREAKRPKNSFLDVSKFQTEFGDGILKTVSESINIFKSQIN